MEKSEPEAPLLFTRYARRKWDRVWSALGCVAAVTAAYLSSNLDQGSSGQKIAAYISLLMSALGFAVPAGFIARARWTSQDERIAKGDEKHEHE